jgi:hypothetical protein
VILIHLVTRSRGDSDAFSHFRGDKAYDVYQGSYFGSIGPYIDKAVRLSPGVRKLLVCTDDPDVVQELATAAERSQIPNLKSPI